ncbi:MAG: hypothetical protein ABSG32_25725 [Terriglobia bacterium]|jgi:hypothetical protein
MFKPNKPEGTPPSQEDMAEMGKMSEEWMKSGVLLATEGCLPSAKGARVPARRRLPLRNHKEA